MADPEVLFACPSCGASAVVTLVAAGPGRPDQVPAAPAKRRTVDMAALRAVDPARMYSCKEIAAILGRSVEWAQGKAAGLARQRRAGKFGPDYQVPGSEVLALAGSLVAIAAPVETETDAEAQRRADAGLKRALDACRRKR